MLQAQELSTTLNAIFNKHEYDSKRFGPARWLDQGAKYTTVEPSTTVSDGQDIVEYETATGKRTVLVSAEKLRPASGAAAMKIDDYSWSTDNKQLLIFTNTKKVWRLNTRGDYWVLDLTSGHMKKLGGDAPESTLMFTKFSPDGKSVAFVRANNIYVQDLATDQVRALTQDGSKTLINGTTDWVTEEELSLRDAFRWSPDSQSIAYWQFDTTGVGEYSLINDTKEEYPVVTTYPYPQPGTTNSAVKIGVVPAQGGTTKWMELPGDPRNHYVPRMEWAKNSNELILEYLNRLQNTNQVLIANVQTGSVRTLFEDKDAAWVDYVRALEWVKDGKELVWLSERDGWRHAYVISRANGEPTLITKFSGDVISEVTVDDAGGWLYFIASPDDAVRRYLYRSRLDGSGTPQRVTPENQPGAHMYDISPDGKWAFHTMSTIDRPSMTELVSLPDHKAIRVLEANDALVKKAQKLISTPTEFFQVPVGDGVKLDGWMIKPPDFDPKKKYPVLVYIYGEPAATTVVDSWGGSRRLFDELIARQGYLVVSFDNQGTPAPKGREWRKSVYGDVGVLSSVQQAAAIRELAKERPYIDSSRLAIWGWSGGGSNTLNMMFRYPGLFKAGIAVAPVADQKHYDTIYQERYMGLPEQNAKGYHDGSAINFAQDLNGKLLVVHGSGDDNVHFQGTELLINRLVELGKPFDMMDYPNRTHSISEGPGTSYHIYSLIARYLEENVPAGGVAQ
ncbi:MAG: S9 family peptidase [Candidatus Korobacteraceae bacterium]